MCVLFQKRKKEQQPSGGASKPAGVRDLLEGEEHLKKLVKESCESTGAADEGQVVLSLSVTPVLHDDDQWCLHR